MRGLRNAVLSTLVPHLLLANVCVGIRTRFCIPAFKLHLVGRFWLVATTHAGIIVKIANVNADCTFGPDSQFFIQRFNR